MKTINARPVRSWLSLKEAFERSRSLLERQDPWDRSIIMKSFSWVPCQLAVKALPENDLIARSLTGQPLKRSSFRNEGWPGTSESFSEANRQSRNSQHSLSLVSTLGILPPGTEEKKRRNGKHLAVDPKEETNESWSSFSYHYLLAYLRRREKNCQQMIRAWSWRECWRGHQAHG